MEEQSVSIRVSLNAYQELTLRKIDSGVPVTKQIDMLLGIGRVKNAKTSKHKRS